MYTTSEFTGDASKTWRITALIATFLWGMLHMVGGAALLLTALIDGGAAGLESLGSATGRDFAADSSPTLTALVAFHGLNILLGGIAVAFLTITRSRTSWPAGFTLSLGIITVLDFGLIVTLLIPGQMRLLDGIWGPLLLLVSLVSGWASGWRFRLKG